MLERTYLDWNATAPLRPEAHVAMIEALALSGNPSSVHAEGRAARRLVEEARERVAALVGAEPRNVVFTSGGTEANAVALSPLTGVASAQRPREALLLSDIEHPSVLAGGRFSPGAVTRVPVTAEGVSDLQALKCLLTAKKSASASGPMVSLMLANNETGVIQPVSEAARMVHEVGCLLHVDAIQAPGRIPCNINDLAADLITISAHKIGGPKGAGALIKRDAALHLDPLIRGGGQERGARGGTENLPGIAGFGAAAAATLRELAVDRAHMATLRDKLEAGLLARTPDAIIFGAGQQRLPNTTLFTLPGLKAETAVIAFDLEGIAVSSGAACSSGKVQPSHVLAAMGVEPALARGAVRVSLGRSTTESDIERFQEAWIKVAGALVKGTKGIAA